MCSSAFCFIWSLFFFAYQQFSLPYLCSMGKRQRIFTTSQHSGCSAEGAELSQPPPVTLPVLVGTATAQFWFCHRRIPLPSPQPVQRRFPQCCFQYFSFQLPGWRLMGRAGNTQGFAAARALLMNCRTFPRSAPVPALKWKSAPFWG